MSCIDLIFCNKRNVISKYRVDASIFDKCHHNISYGKTEICVPLPPKYVREVWDYSKADVQNIKKSIKDFNWRKTFESLSVDSKVDLLNERLLNIFWNYVTNKKIECDYRQPLWMTNSIKRSLKESFKLTKCYYKNGQKKSDYEKLLEKSSDCTKQILEAKNNYVLKVTTKLQDPKTSTKTCWAISSRLLYKEKIPAIPPLFVNGKFFSDCCDKANLFNNFFASISTLTKDSSVLPLFSYRTNAKITSFDFTEEDISLILKNLDPAKANG